MNPFWSETTISLVATAYVLAAVFLISLLFPVKKRETPEEAQEAEDWRRKQVDKAIRDNHPRYRASLMNDHSHTVVRLQERKRGQ